MGEMKNVYNILIRKPEGKRPLGRSGCRWEDITVQSRENGWVGVGWILLAQDRDQWRALVYTVMNFLVT
jgi:hypothetical protein